MCCISTICIGTSCLVGSMRHALRGWMLTVLADTSRPKRDGEVDGDKYHFITEDEFRAGIKQGEFLEHGELCGVLYGTKKCVPVMLCCR